MHLYRPIAFAFPPSAPCGTGLEEGWRRIAVTNRKEESL
jgi:hypothetical protein